MGCCLCWSGLKRWPSRHRYASMAKMARAGGQQMLQGELILFGAVCLRKAFKIDLLEVRWRDDGRALCDVFLGQCMHVEGDFSAEQRFEIKPVEMVVQ